MDKKRKKKGGVNYKNLIISRTKGYFLVKQKNIFDNFLKVFFR